MLIWNYPNYVCILHLWITCRYVAIGQLKIQVDGICWPFTLTHYSVSEPHLCHTTTEDRYHTDVSQCSVYYSAVDLAIVRPPDIVCRRTYILPVFLLSFFRRLISEVAERNSTKIGHMVGSVIWKRISEIWDNPSPYKSGGQKPLFGRFTRKQCMKR